MSMYNDPRRASITPGTDVYDTNGDKVGMVQQSNAEAGYLMVQKGIFFIRDLYIPTNAIERITTDGIRLNLSKDELKEDQYTAPPVVGTTASMAGTDVAGRGDRFSRDQDVNIPVREEELSVDKQRGEVGRAAIHKDVVEEEESVNIPVTHERVEIERVPVDKDLADDAVSAQNWQDKDIVMPVMGEEVVTEKRPRVKEEIHIHKEPITETERVSETVRKERVNVDGLDEQGEPLGRRADQTLDADADDLDTNP